MTLNEFKAWLEGFEAAMNGNPPTADQWSAIKAKLGKVEVARVEMPGFRPAEPKIRYL